MKEKLLQAKAGPQIQIDQIDEALKFFDEHPEMEHLLVAVIALQRLPYAVPM